MPAGSTLGGQMEYLEPKTQRAPRVTPPVRDREADVTHAQRTRAGSLPAASPAALLHLQRHAGNQAVTALLQRQATQAPAGPAPTVQRRMNWQKTDWSKAQHMDVSAGGGGGVLFVGEDGVKEVVVKPGEEMAAEGALAAHLHNEVAAGGTGSKKGRKEGDITFSANGLRMPGPAEQQKIVSALTPLLKNVTSNPGKAKDRVDRLGDPGLLVQDLAAGREMQDLMKALPKHQDAGKGGQQELSKSSAARIFTDPRSIRGLGVNTGVDLFFGNKDRLFMLNPENLVMTPYSVTFIDNIWGGTSASGLRTIKTEGRWGAPDMVTTRDEAMNAWKADEKTLKLAQGDYKGLAEQAWESASVALGRLIYTGMNKQTTMDQRAFTEAMKPYRSTFMKEFPAGLQDGKNRLITSLGKLLQNPAKLASIVVKDVDEIQLSIQERMDFLAGKSGGGKKKSKSRFPFKFGR